MSIRKFQKPLEFHFPEYFALIVLASGVVLQLWRLTYVTLWSDEYLGTLRLIQFPWQDIVTGNYPWDFNPPLYFLVLKGWVTIFGSQDESIMRMLSVFISSASMIFIFLLGKRMGNWRVGIALMLVLAFHPVYQLHSTSLRMYPLLILLSILALLFYMQYTSEDRHSKWWLLALSFTLALATYTHYFGIFVLLGILVFAISNWIAKKDLGQVPIFYSILLSILLTIPIILIIMKQYTRYVEKTISTSIIYIPIKIQSILAVLSGSVSYDFKATNVLQVISLLAVLSGIVILFRNGRKITAISLLVFVCLSWMITLVLSNNGINIVPRYLIHIFLVSWILLALSFVETHDKLSKLLRLFALVAIGIMILFGFNSAVAKEYPYPNWKNIARILQKEAHINEPIVIMGWDATPTSFYLNSGYLSSYQLEEQISKGEVNSYLILDSINARKLDFIDYADPIYENLTEGVSIIRYAPAAPTMPPEKQLP